MFTYTFTIYESGGNTTVTANSLSQTFKIDEALDSAQLVIPRSTRKENFNRFSPVRVQITEGATTYTYWWLIYTSKSELESFGTTARYTHTLALIETTKMLEKYICGSLTFTQPLGGTQYTLKDVVDRILLLTPFVKYDDISSTRVITLNTTLANLLNKITSPQLYFDKKNLREALIETLKYVNAIPRITFNGTTWELTADYINNRHLNIEVESGVLDYVNEADSNDFSTRAEIFHENTIPNEDEDYENVCENSISELVICNTNEGVIVGDSNFKLVLKNKVYKIISISALVRSSSDTSEEVEIDLNDYLYEKKEYDQLEYDNSGTNFDYGTRACAFFWQYQSNILDGLNTGYKIFATNQALVNIVDHALYYQYSTAFKDPAFTFTSIGFLVKYIPYIELDRSEQYREDVSDQTLPTSFAYDNTAIIINPNERINSLYKLTKNAYGQIQRLGVNTIGFSLKHKTLAAYNGSNNGVYSLGDYTDDGYFVTTVEIVYFTTFVIARYEMSKNFNRMAQFISIDKEFRPYEITLTKSDYTLKRDILMPFKQIEISASSNANHESSTLVTEFMKTFGNSLYALPVTCATFRLGDGEIWNDSGVLMPVILLAEKNTLKFKVDFVDTKLAGNRLETQNVGAIHYEKQIQVPYTEDDGTAEFYKIDLFKSFYDKTSGTAYSTSAYRMTALSLLSKQYPLITYIEAYSDAKHVYYYILATAELGSVDAHIYTNEAVFLAMAGVIDDYYYGEDTGRLWKYDSVTSPDGYALISNNVVAIQNAPQYELPIYKVLKDRSEILGFEMTMPILTKKSEVNRFIIGDMLSKDNVLIKHRDTSRTLYIQSNTNRYTKANSQNTGSVTAFTGFNPAWISGNHINIPTNVQALDNYAITDAQGNLYLAVNQKNLDGTKTVVSTIYFNFVDERS